MPMTAAKTVLSPTARTFAILCGAVLWAILFGVAGALAQRAWIGAVVGVLFGAVSAWFAVYFDRKTAVKDEGGIRSVPRHGKPPVDSAST